MQAYLVGPQDPQEPLFKSQRGARLSVNAIDYVVRQIARDAGVKMSAHTLRHCALSQMVRQGVDIVTVAELAGHSRLETTRRYSLPTANDKINAVEKLVDYAKT
jgi:integrase/recombinase XerC